MLSWVWGWRVILQYCWEGAKLLFPSGALGMGQGVGEETLTPDKS